VDVDNDTPFYSGPTPLDLNGLSFSIHLFGPYINIGTPVPPGTSVGVPYLAASFDSGLIYPQVYAAGNWLFEAVVPPGNFEDVYLQFLQWYTIEAEAIANAGGGGVGSGGTLTIDGVDFPLFAPTDFYFDSSVSIIATPTEFWPYKTSTGLPVYDTATGAQINDPLS
jgi:hypothetical protein